MAKHTPLTLHDLKANLYSSASPSAMVNAAEVLVSLASLTPEEQNAFRSLCVFALSQHISPTSDAAKLFCLYDLSPNEDLGLRRLVEICCRCLCTLGVEIAKRDIIGAGEAMRKKRDRKPTTTKRNVEWLYLSFLQELTPGQIAKKVSTPQKKVPRATVVSALWRIKRDIEQGKVERPEWFKSN